MTKRFLLVSLIIGALSLAAGTTFRRKEVSPMTNRAPSATNYNEASVAARIQNSAQSPVGAVGDERRRTTLEVAKSSRRTVLARCRSVDVREDAGGNIFTFYEFEVLQKLKGGAGENSFTLRLLGGRVGNAEVTPVLDVGFVPGKKYVLFLGRENDEGYPTIASQSIFQVMTSPLDKREVVSPSPTGLNLYEATSGRKYVETPDLLLLEDFLFSIKKLDN